MADIQIRKARLADVPGMVELINAYAGSGLMLPRTEFEMCENIRDFSVAERDSELLGCGALHFYTPQMAEIRSLAVAERVKTEGVGRRIVDALIEEGREYELDIVFAFTYVVPFFEKCGFQVVDRGTLPLKAWKDCVRCPHFTACDEVAMVYLISEKARAAEDGNNDGLIHLSSHVTRWPGRDDELIEVPTPAPGLVKIGGFQGR
jgi:amino-acid N-acetyltransferase